MSDNLEIYWKKRIEKCQNALENNNFEVYLAGNTVEANQIIFNDILPKIAVKSVSWGDSMTFYSTDVLHSLKQYPEIQVIETFAKDLPREKSIERRRQALLVDVFFTGSNALTESGKLVNLDMIGNRIAGIIFGPQFVVIIVGRNKIVSDLEDAMYRIKNYAAPLNAIRHKDFKTPCRETSFCMDCKSPDRICNVWSITEKSYPKGRIKVIIINQDLGL
ncbi:MAG: lactate utilization protein [Deltaproteobacteria bacterium]|jgi:L-lactate utilization protein LutB|nr:lactate utilization protein [Deltaproteobacteria bacterium]MBT4642026.1 lactate utilization protein [Deltaproteobacteria bacterium]MBT6499930.1 lactate utilization protein [Deltaproteobacteria bacterium]MBT7153389.1 lactate utilization protein [Deltaproteobacteria bacterium]MBT7715452.1 lactate utilization protein [Deltaproteobacteria bacterium]